MNDFVYTRGCESAQRKLVEYYRFSLRRFFYRACLNTIVNTVLVNTARETFEYHTFAFRKFLFGREREREFKVDYGLVYKLIRLTKVFYNVRMLLRDVLIIILYKMRAIIRVKVYPFVVFIFRLKKWTRTGKRFQLISSSRKSNVQKLPKTYR